MNEQERQYDTYQEGPYWRVNPRPTGESGQGDSSLRAQDGNADAGNPPGLARYGNAQSPAASQPVAVDFAHRAADEYSRKHLGKPYAPIENTSSSLRKQGAIGRIFKLAATHHPEYKQAVFDAYKAQRPDIAGDAKDYDDLRRRAYTQLAHETKKQFDTLPVRMSFHRNGEGNYGSSQDMLNDVAKNRHLYVYQGGDPHEFLHEVDPRTGLNTNEMFRAVHDFFGHAVHGSSFGPHGEEKAWAAHSGLFTPLAQAALTSETRGQNSMVNYSPLNALLKARAAKLTEAMMDAHRRGDMDSHAELSALKKQLMDSFEFAPQAAVLLPPEFLHGGFKGGVPEYLKHLVVPEHGTSADLVHYSHQPNLSGTDPRMYGTGIRGAESRRLKDAPGGIPRTYYYVGEPRQRETGLGPHKYKATVDRLYDIEQDPEHLLQLARETNRTPHTAKYNQGIVDEDRAANEFERMAHEYGYKGVVNHARKVASVFDPQDVQSYARGGLVSRVDQAAANLRRLKGTPQEFLSELAATPGVKKTELEARGLNDPNALPKQPMKRQDFNRLLGTHPHAAPHVTIHHAGGPGTEDADPEGFRQWTLPGGKDYREMLFQHPHKEGVPFIGQHYSTPDVLAHARLVDRTGPNGEKVLHVEEIQSDWHQQGRKHGYRAPETTKMFDQAVKDAHAAKRELQAAKDEVVRAEQRGDEQARNAAANRVAELTGPALRTQAQLDDVTRDNKKRVPDAPWKKDWHEMVLRHLLKHAVDNDYDALAVTPGEEQAKRYDLSKHIGAVEYYPNQGRLIAKTPSFDQVMDKRNLEPHELGEHIGEELAQKLLNAPRDYSGAHVLKGQDVRVGGEGMKGFYDRMVPIAMNKLGKPYGVRVGTMAIPKQRPPLMTGDILDDLARRGHSQEQINNMRAADLAAHQRLMEDERDAQPVPTINLHTLPITDKMREDVKTNGLPLFAKGGEVHDTPEFRRWFGDSEAVDEQGRPLHNSLGQELHPTREGRNAFWNWFGDSSMVDAQGRPQVFYHSTLDDKRQFEPHGEFMGHTGVSGISVTDSPEMANRYLDRYASHGWINGVPNQPFQKNVMPVYVRAQNPLTRQEPFSTGHAMGAPLPKNYTLPTELAPHDALVRDDAISRRGTVKHSTAKNAIKGREVVLFHPHQIKSAIGNRGTFDPKNPDITMAAGGEVDVDTMRAALALRKKPKAAPQEAALEKARLNAVRMLGLPENNTPEDRAKALGFVHDFYHGTERMDRLLEKPYLDPKRATSGPMPYGTDNPQVASNYATSKADTSYVAQDEGSLEHYFQVHPKVLGLRGSAPYSVERSFHFLPPEVKQEIHAKAPNVGYEDPEQAEGAFVAHPTPAGALTAKEHYDYILKREARGNPLTALRILFGDSGTIFGEEHKLADVFKAAGYPHQISQINAPWEKAEGVFTGKARARNPLYTHDTEHLQQNVIPALEKALARDRSRTKPGADSWDKNARYTPKDWLKQLKEDINKGANSYVWTSIPDKVTSALKELGHDAIVDTGGKSEGATGHTVTIPFNPEQVRSRFAAYDPEKSGEKGLLLAQGGTVQTQNNLITTLAQRLGMTPAQVMQAIQQQQPQGLAEGGQPDKKRKKKKDGRLSLSDLMRLSSVGADEAPDLPIKEFTDPGHSMIPEGGVQMPNGAPFPIGPQQQAQAAQSQTGIPGQVQGGAPLAAIASMLHQGAAGAPQPGQQPGQGNMLALTHQGQAMQAMRPPVPQQPPQRPQMAPQRPGMPAMAKGGNVKMSTADMKRALQARKRTAK